MTYLQMSKSNVNVGFKFHPSYKKAINKKSGKTLKWKNKISYITRDEVYKNHNENFIEDLKKNIDSFLFTGYLNREKANENKEIVFKKNIEENKNESSKVMYYSSGKEVLNTDIYTLIENETLLDKLQEKNNSCYYESYISFEKEFSKKNIINKISEKDLYETIEPALSKFLTKNGFEKDNTKHFVAFHTNTENVHLHFDFIELESTRKKNLLKKNSFGELRKDLMLIIDKELSKEYKERTTNLQETKTQLRNEIKQFDFEYDFTKLIKHYEENPIRFYGDIKDKEFKKEVDKAKFKFYEQTLTTPNELGITYVDFLKQLESQEEYNKNLYGDSTRSQRDNQLEEIDKIISNKIVNTLKYQNKKSKLDGINNEADKYLNDLDLSKALDLYRKNPTDKFEDITDQKLINEIKNLKHEMYKDILTNPKTELGEAYNEYKKLNNKSSNGEAGNRLDDMINKKIIKILKTEQKEIIQANQTNKYRKFNTTKYNNIDFEIKRAIAKSKKNDDKAIRDFEQMFEIER